MPFAWTLARLLFRVVAPSIPEVITTITRLKSEQVHERAEKESQEARLVDLEKTMTSQLQLIEQLTSQLVALEKSIRLALSLAVVGLVLSLTALGFLIIR